MFGILKQVQGWVKLKGDTSGTKIGNVGDRLKTSPTATTVPNEKLTLVREQLTDTGASPDMDVDGSSVNVVYSAGPGAGEVFYLYKLALLIDDSGTSSRTAFGAIAGGLTNGILIEFTIDGTTYTSGVIKNNAELVEGFNTYFRGQTGSFINDANFFSGATLLPEHVTLIGDDGDKLEVTVRDNLTGLDLMQVGAFFFKVI